jgi:hypothetical protein
MKLLIIPVAAIIIAASVGCIGYAGGEGNLDNHPINAPTALPYNAVPADQAEYEDMCLTLYIANGGATCPDVIFPSGSGDPMEPGETRVLPDGSTITMVEELP